MSNLAFSQKKTRTVALEKYRHLCVAFETTKRIGTNDPTTMPQVWLSGTRSFRELGWQLGCAFELHCFLLWALRHTAEMISPKLLAFMPSCPDPLVGCFGSYSIMEGKPPRVKHCL